MLGTAPIFYAYIDPGTGSMLFTILISLASVIIYGLKKLSFKLRFGISKKDKETKKRVSYVIYSDNKRYWSSFKGICEEFDKRNIDVIYLTQSIDDYVFDCGLNHIKPEYIGNDNKSFAKLNFLNAKLVLSTTPGLDVYQWKRSKEVDYYVHIPHMINDITTYRMFGIDYYDSILVANEIQKKQIEKLEEIRNLNKKDIQVVGLTYFDELNSKLNNRIIEKSKNDCIKVLLAPSWGKSGILMKFGEEMLNALIKTGYKIIVRPHPQSFISEKELIDNLMTKYPNNENLVWDMESDNFNSLNESDIMISDFSGVFFDYLFVFNKPIIYADTSFDYSPYDAWWMDEELWTFKELPKLGYKIDEKSINNIKDIIDNCIKNDELKKYRESLKELCWCNQMLSSKTIVDYLIKINNTGENE